jgi:SSS family solute:Na+ symporter
MGLSFAFTVLLMVGVSLLGPKESVHALRLDAKMFRLEPGTLALIVVTLLLFTMLYVKFW